MSDGPAENLNPQEREAARLINEYRGVRKTRIAPINTQNRPSYLAESPDSATINKSATHKK